MTSYAGFNTSVGLELYLSLSHAHADKQKNKKQIYIYIYVCVYIYIYIYIKKKPYTNYKFMLTSLRITLLPFCPSLETSFLQHSSSRNAPATVTPSSLPHAPGDNITIVSN